MRDSREPLMTTRSEILRRVNVHLRLTAEDLGFRSIIAKLDELEALDVSNAPALPAPFQYTERLRLRSDAVNQQLRVPHCSRILSA